MKAVTFHTTSLKVHFIRSVLGLSGFSPSSSILEDSPPLNQTFLRLSGRWTGVNRVPMVGTFVLIVEKGQRPLRRRIGGSWSFLQGQPLQAEEQVISHQETGLRDHAWTTRCTSQDHPYSLHKVCHAASSRAFRSRRAFPRSNNLSTRLPPPLCLQASVPRVCLNDVFFNCSLSLSGVGLAMGCF